MVWWCKVFKWCCGVKCLNGVVLSVKLVWCKIFEWCGVKCYINGIKRACGIMGLKCVNGMWRSEVCGKCNALYVGK